MLVLSRKIGEAVLVGKDVEVFVVNVSRGRVKLGFRAPLATAIRRVEAATPGDVAEGCGVEQPSSAADVDRENLSLTAPLRQFRMVGVA